MCKYRIITDVRSGGKIDHRIEQKFFKLFWCELGTYRGFGEGAYFVREYYPNIRGALKKIKKLYSHQL